MKVHVPLVAGILGVAFLPGNVKSFDCNKDPDAHPYDEEFLAQLNTTLCGMDDEDTYIEDDISPKEAAERICAYDEEWNKYLNNLEYDPSLREEYSAVIREIDYRKNLVGCTYPQNSKCRECAKVAYIKIAQVLHWNATDYTDDVCTPIGKLESCLEGNQCEMFGYKEWTEKEIGNWQHICPQNETDLGKNLRA